MENQNEVIVSIIKPVSPQRGVSLEKPEQRKKRVAAYCRVSTEEEIQQSSYDLQVEYYKNLIEKEKEWQFAGIYADEGITGTSTRKRLEFNRLIQNCRDGEIDLIITKSISRFARNTLDCLNYIKELKMLTPPVGIFFEKEKIFSLDTKSDLILTVLASVAQEESRSISENARWAKAKRYAKGNPSYGLQRLLGYSKTKRGEFVIDESEAVIIRRIYELFLSGHKLYQIARMLTDEGVKTPGGKDHWYYSTVRGIIMNEKYCGDAILQKSFRPDFLSQTIVKNTGQMPMYLVQNCYPAIIRRRDWQKAQELLKNRQN